ncbi:receptor-like protein EIX2 [Corylus avellana]|uniref:receptor-like protein EIX2 n=1 Tax=Corylus avellana TaxID=13451 RepID=UPI00286C3E39|nr:receptor-like protein EIX2 [Corylus avellana]
MRGPYAALLLLLGLLLLLLCTATSICFGLNFRNSEVRCIEEERQALLKFKRGLQDDDGLLSSWGSHEEDCCNWKGIKCSNRTAHVVKLDLRGDLSFDEVLFHKGLYGEINSSLLGLQHLTYLDLSGNDFNFILPEFIGSLTKLQYLNLSYNSFSGTIPQQLGNLTSLTSLDLSWNSGKIEDHNLDWLFNLSSLRHLDMSYVNLSKVVNWPDKVTMLPSLLDLSLQSCQLSVPIPPVLFNANSSSPLLSLDLSDNHLNSSVFPWLFEYTNSLVFLNLGINNLEGSIPRAFGNMVALVHLDLSFNNLEGSIPRAFGNMVALVHLDLCYNNLEGSIPRAFGNMVALVHLDLFYNNLEGSIPRAFGNMVALVHLGLSYNNLGGMMPRTLENLHNLQVLDLSSNNISGEVLDLSNFSFLRELRLSNNRLNRSLTKSVGELSMLQVLDVSSNSLEGDVTEAHLSNLSSLNQLDLSFNSLSLKFSSNWVPPFHLDIIRLSSCKLGSTFPQWLQTQKNFSELEMSDVGISDTIPNWFWNLSSNINLLNLSHNHIKGTIPLHWFSSSFFDYHITDLSYNHFSGPLPQLNSNWSLLNLSNNKFQGSITSICQTNRSMSDSGYFDLSNNFLSGELPNCWRDMRLLSKFSLANNNFFGRIPDSFGSICDSVGGRSTLETLDLHNNNFIGELPKSLINCSSLELLDLGENRLSERIPTWIGTSLPHLIILRLASNLFVGHIPLQLCHLTSLQILDLSHNDIRGTIPKCLNNFTVMAQTQSSKVSISHDLIIWRDTNGMYMSTYMDNLMVAFKEKYLEYSKTLGLVKLIDLSSNKLKGEIPKEITSLSGLIGLNLSRNLLTGIIPHNIGDMERLESLDLSKNHLSGIIPPSLVDLTFLSDLILSDNNLSGRIPKGTQLQSFSASAYIGNQDLCGLPLLKRCPGDEAAQGPRTSSIDGEGNNQEHANSHEHLWFYTSIVLGFIVGFWGICGSLLLKSSWRHAYFQYLERIGDWLYVTIAIGMAKLLRK